MDARVINQFIVAARNTFKNVGNVELKKEGLDFFPEGRRISGGVAALIGLSGSLRGQLVLLIDQQMAVKIARAILLGVPVSTYDEVAESAVSEMANMIAGDAGRLLHDAGFACDLTVPSIINGNSLEIGFYPPSPVFAVKFSCHWGTVELVVRLEAPRK